MTPLLIVEYILIGALLISCFFSLSLVIAKYEVKRNLIFGGISLLLIVVTIGYILRYSADNVADFIFAEKILQSSIFLAGALLVWFLENLTHYKSKYVKWILILGFVFAAIYNSLAEFGSDYESIIDFTLIELPWGEKIFNAVGEMSKFFWLIDLLIIIALYYVIVSTRFLFKSGAKSESILIGLSFFLIIISILFDDLFIETEKVALPHTQQFAYISIVFLSGYKGLKSLTTLRKTELALFQSEAKYKQLNHLNFDGVCLTKDGIIIEMNDRFQQMFLFSKEELTGTNINHLYKRDTDVEETKNFDYDDIVRKWCFRKDSDEFPIELRTEPILVEGEKCYVNVLRDITKRKQFEDQLVEAKNMAETSERLKAEFLTQMSHEIRSPINTLLNFASLLASELAGKIDSELEDSFGVMQKAGNRIIRTIDLLLNMAEIQTDTYEPIKKEIHLIDEVLSQIFLEYGSMARNQNLHFELNNNIGKKDPVIFGDKYTLNQIFNNLIDNAIKYTEKGSVIVEVSNGVEGKLFVDVIDTGVGISEEYLPDIFDTFSQEEQGYTRRYDGNGLGLALVKNYLKINDAEIEVNSKKNHGTHFRVIFNYSL